MTDTAAADLRTKLDLALGEHIILAAKATEAALGGRNDEFAAYGDLLNTNGTDLGAMIGSVYGGRRRTQFNQIWSAHNGFFVDYTTGVAKKDKANAGQGGPGPDPPFTSRSSPTSSAAPPASPRMLWSLHTDHVLQTKAAGRRPGQG